MVWQFRLVLVAAVSPALHSGFILLQSLATREAPDRLARKKAGDWLYLFFFLDKQWIIL